MKPSIGRIVHYRLTEQDAVVTNRRRARHLTGWPMGTQAHVGNGVVLGELVPLIVTQVWPNEHRLDLDGVNGQCILDGNDSLWVTSVKEGVEPGTWRWPAHVE